MERERDARPLLRRALLAAAVGSVQAASGGHAQPAGEPWRLAPQPLVELGRVDGSPEELFSRIVGAVRLDDGRFVVADGRELRLSVIGPNSRLLTTFGSRGQGPGEFRWLSAIWNAGGDTIGIWDPRAPRITRFLPDGQVVGTHRPSFGPRGAPVPSGNLDLFLGAFDDGRVGLAWLVQPRLALGELLPDRMVLGLFDAEGRFQRLLGEADGMVRLYTEEGGGPFVFSPFPWSATVRDTLVYASGLGGEALFFDTESAEPGEARTLSLAGRRVALGEAWEALDAALAESEPHPLQLALARRTDRSVGQVPTHGRMFADSEGRLWLKQYDPSTDAMPVRPGRFAAGGRWEVLETDGTPVARITMPDDVAPLAVYGDTLLGVARGAFDVERFVVYRVVR